MVECGISTPGKAYPHERTECKTDGSRSTHCVGVTIVIKVDKERFFFPKKEIESGICRGKCSLVSLFSSDETLL
jgi:hypothetical protein